MHTTFTPRPVAIGPDAAVHLGDDLELAFLAVTAGFFAHGSNDSPQLSEGRILSVFEYTTTWPYWERHPTGDELVYLLFGDVELLLDDDEQSRVIVMRVGDAAIVPTGAWHRAVIRAPSRLLFITPTPRHTQQRFVTPDNEVQ